MQIPRTQMVKRISETTDPSNPTKHIEPLRENPNRRKESKNVENEPEGLDSEGRTVDRSKRRTPRFETRRFPREEIDGPWQSIPLEWLVVFDHVQRSTWAVTWGTEMEGASRLLPVMVVRPVQLHLFRIQQGELTIWHASFFSSSLNVERASFSTWLSSS